MQRSERKTGTFALQKLFFVAFKVGIHGLATFERTDCLKRTE